MVDPDSEVSHCATRKRAFLISSYTGDLGVRLDISFGAWNTRVARNL